MSGGGPDGDGWVAFEAAIVPVEWGRATYTVLPLPDAAMDALGHPARVEGEVAEHPVNLSPQRAPVLEGAFLWAGKAFLSAAGIAPGEVVEVRLRAADPDAVKVPPDLAAALRAAGRTDAWEAATPGARRGWLHPVLSAKRPETRARRIAALVAALG